jgi:hypothetical protein
MRITWSAKGKPIDMTETLKRDAKEIATYAAIGLVIGVIFALITRQWIAGLIMFVVVTVGYVMTAPKEGYVEKKDEP